MLFEISITFSLPYVFPEITTCSDILKENFSKFRDFPSENADSFTALV